MTVLTQSTLEEILNYLDSSIENLANDVKTNSEFHSDTQKLDDFISNQFDIRLENMLNAKNSSIHHLESAMKNKIIQRKKSLIEKLNI